MIASTPSRQTTVAVALGGFAAIEGVAFLLAGLSHAGMRILPFDEPRIVDAAIVEGLCGILLVASAVSVFARATWAWLALVVAHAFTLLGVLVGIASIAAGLGPHSAFNDGFHRVTLVVLAVVLIVLATPPVRTALRTWSEGEKHASNHPV
jgi:protein-S-isoprenylcysteine O-methyltransferase Ste14